MAPRSSESLSDHTAGIKSAQALNVSIDVTLARITRALYVGGGGNIVVVFADDPDAGAVTLTGLAAGVWHPMQIQKIIASGTTATLVVAGY